MAGSSLAQVFFVSANAVVPRTGDAMGTHVCGNKHYDNWVVVNGAQCWNPGRLTLSWVRGTDMTTAIGRLRNPKPK